MSNQIKCILYLGARGRFRTINLRVNGCKHRDLVTIGGIPRRLIANTIVLQRGNKY